MLQASASEREGRVFARVRELMQHRAFTLKNPNRARSLISSFCLRNPGAFHRADAAGYVFWAERVIELDALNPQLASRVARALDRWMHLAEPYRSAAREAIARVALRSRPERRRARDRHQGAAGGARAASQIERSRGGSAAVSRVATAAANSSRRSAHASAQRDVRR